MMQRIQTWLIDVGFMGTVTLMTGHQNYLVTNMLMDIDIVHQQLELLILVLFLMEQVMLALITDYRIKSVI